MKASRLLALSLLLPVFASADSLRGVITSSNGQPLSAVAVTAEGYASIRTTEDGRFSFQLPAGTYTLRVSREGFQAQSVDVATGENVSVSLVPVLADNIVVAGIRAEAGTPVTKSDLSRGQIARSYYGQDIPLLLRETPSIHAYAEGGVGGAGYSYITLRGISPTRLNFTFNGIPLADPEDMGTYFVDFPDLARSLESVQIQRGVGTSTVGSPSFGGSVNLESIALSSSRVLDASVAAGSFGTRTASVGYQTGELSGGYAAYGRVSYQETAGFRENSAVRQHSFFLSAAHRGESSQLKLTGFAGNEAQQLSFFAADEDSLRQNIRANPLPAEARDRFGYNLAELQYLRENTTASVYFQRGAGWYRLEDRQYGLDGLLIGSMLTHSATWRGVAANYGFHINHFRREHTRDLVSGPRDYFNYGTKSEANGFAKFTRDSGAWRLYGDVQVRTTQFRYSGDVAIPTIRWTFLNPKLGARYQLSPQSSVYASLGSSRREPTRNDMFQGQDNPTIAHDLRAVRPEELIDFEAGWDSRGPGGSLAANVYFMEFRNEIAATGELSPIGLPLRRNVDRSYRRGIELEGDLAFGPSMRLRGSASLSRNRIQAWTQFYDVYDAGGAYVESRPLVHRNVAPLLTPSVIINQSVDYMPSSRVTLTATGRYVGSSFLDNTENRAFTTPSFVTLDGTVGWKVAKNARIRMQINNVLNNRRVFGSGYSYLFLNPAGSIDGVRYYYPQATRHAVVTLDVNL